MFEVGSLTIFQIRIKLYIFNNVMILIQIFFGQYHCNQKLMFSILQELCVLAEPTEKACHLLIVGKFAIPCDWFKVFDLCGKHVFILFFIYYFQSRPFDSRLVIYFSFEYFESKLDDQWLFFSHIQLLLLMKARSLGDKLLSKCSKN